jgi:hypothetical protein
MEAMPRPRPPHLQRQVTRHGKTVWYVRVGKGPRVRMRSAFGTPEFHAEYQVAIAGQRAGDVSKAAQTITGSLAWLIERYRETGEWTRLSLATRRLRENVFRHVVDSAGVQPAANITSATIMVARDRRTAIQAKHFLSAMRGLFRWAFRARLVKSDPTVGVNDLPLPKNDGHVPWSMAMWPLMRRVGHLEHVSASGLTCSPTQAYAVATLCALAASICGTASRPSRRRRPVRS